MDDEAKVALPSTEQVALLESQLDGSFKDRSLHSPKIIQNIVKLVMENGLPPVICERSAEKLAEYIKNASHYKKRKLAERISKLEVLTKVLISQSLQRMEVKHFSLEKCLSKSSRKGKIKNGVNRFLKNLCPQPMAFGLNRNGRLGIGDEEDKVVDKLTPIEIPGEVVQVHMGEYHTIFEMKGGDFYGCGKESNFMENAHGSVKNIMIPEKLPYFKNECSVPATILMKDGGTKIENYNRNATLLIGNYDERNRTRAEGQNWRIVNKKNAIEENRINKEAMIRTIQVDTHKGEKRTIKISKDCTWIGKDGQCLDIVFIIDGFRVDSDKLWKNYTICSNGGIVALVDGNIYKGKFISAKRMYPYSEDSSSEEEETEVDEEVVIVKRDDVLLAVMEEVILPYSFDGIAISEDGESFICWAKNQKSIEKGRELEKLEKTLQSEQVNEYLLRIPKYELDMDTTDGKQLMDNFEMQSREYMDMKEVGEMFLHSGVPKDINFIRTLLELKYFLRFDKIKAAPEVFIKNLNADKTLNIDGIKEELRLAVKMCYRIPVITVNADYSDEQLPKRKAQIKAKGLKYIANLVEEVRTLLEAYNNMSLKYRVNNLEIKFGRYIGLLIEHMHIGRCSFGENKEQVKLQKVQGFFDRHHYQEALKERLKNNDIEKDDQENPRWASIRVEAVAFPETEIELFIVAPCSNHTIYYTHTSKFHIMCIDPTLIPFIDDGVLSLNAACINEDGPSRFRQLMDAFFLIRDDNLHLTSVKKRFDVESVARKLNAKDKYRITTSEGNVLRLPKVLFEVFSEYDAGRRRMATVMKNDPDVFNLNFSTDAIKLALSCLIDVRTFYNAEMELKMEVFEMCRYLMLSGIRQELLRMIIMTAKEEDHNHVASLIWQGPLEEITDLIAKNRPDMMLFWKKVPIEDNYLPILDKIAKKMFERHYKTYECSLGETRLPVVALRDERTDNERIHQKFLFSYLSKTEQDADITFDLARTITEWGIENPHRRKRPNVDRLL